MRNSRHYPHPKRKKRPPNHHHVMGDLRWKMLKAKEQKNMIQFFDKLNNAIAFTINFALMGEYCNYY